MDTRRLLLFIVFSFSLIVLWGEWSNRNQPHSSLNEVAEKTNLPQPVERATPAPQRHVAAAVMADGEMIHVVTDTLEVELNTAGANLQKVSLLKHKDANDTSKPIVLMQRRDDHTYLAQSGLLGEGLPTHIATYNAVQKEFKLEDGADELRVEFTASENKNARVSKVYVFHRGSYLVDVSYRIENMSQVSLVPSAYFQFVRDSSAPQGASVFIPTYTGPAFYTDAEKFKKVDFPSIEKKKADLPPASDNGWVGMLQHYFVAAWLPQNGTKREFYARQLDGGLYSAGLVLAVPEIKVGEQAVFGTQLYVGPAKSKLDEVALGLGLTVDYGIFTIFATPLFWLMSFINQWVGNWGFSIILLTVLIKLAFFPLSAASYRSMAKMRVVAPKLEKIKKQYGDDRERLNKAMMDLYKTEKINPLGGCLPVLIQIPVFIGLYWSILESVELRHAPFIGWIIDLSATDPYFVLPVIMGVSMLIQTRLNPVPADPLQAKIMKIMPIAFSIIFFFFPAGLVLYSIVNNVLSISQQWYITRAAEAGQKGGAKD
ncbi:MAG: membrane protein insertase YidC [Gallionella sp.]|nr:membrane protein insertase YidC [Gallionella sp.]PIR09613.1 MAG: membrane protein insertase YidC [Gallionellaceae bacterium CG11_big_fil_rev_8_21_14_0_20_60_62]